MRNRIVRLLINCAKHLTAGLLATAVGMQCAIAADEPEWVQSVRQRAEAGDAEAEKALGDFYYTGRGVPQNHGEAALWYRFAAGRGHVQAQFNLGAMYHNGQGIPRSNVEAMRWWRRAAEQGHAEAQNNVAQFYHLGEIVLKDSAKAAKWWRRAAEQGHVVAQRNLGALHHRGEGVPRNYAEAAKWWRRAAARGNADAQFYLGSALARGEGVPQNFQRAYAWLALATENGRRQALEIRAEAARRLSAGEKTEAKSMAEAWRSAIANNLPLPEFGPRESDGNLPTPRGAENVFDAVWRSVVVIRAGSGQGGGVVVRPNLVATNCHVTDGGSQIMVSQARDGRTIQSDALPARIIAENRGRDVCLLSVAGMRGIPANPRGSRSLKIGEGVFAVGSPQGLSYSMSDGIVSQLRSEGGDAPLIQTNAAISPGSSGGGLFDAKGNWIGITTFKREGENLNFAVPVEWALELIP